MELGELSELLGGEVFRWELVNSWSSGVEERQKRETFEVRQPSLHLYGGDAASC